MSDKFQGHWEAALGEAVGAKGRADLWRKIGIAAVGADIVPPQPVSAQPSAEGIPDVWLYFSETTDLVPLKCGHSVRYGEAFGRFTSAGTAQDKCESCAGAPALIGDETLERLRKA